MALLPRAAPRPYVPAVGPRLKVLLAVLFVFVAILGASGAYLLAIRLLDWHGGQEKIYTNAFTFWTLIGHIGLGLPGLVLFILFGVWHLATAYGRQNRVAVRLGIGLLVLGVLAGLTGVALVQLEGFPQLPTATLTRDVVRLLHLALPLVAIVLYILHRKAGPPLKRSWGYGWLATTGAFVVAMVVLHRLDPKPLATQAPPEGEYYFHPSEARTANGNFIPAQALMMDDYCKRCHADTANDHFHSAHRFSSFNNPPYLFSVRETRKVGLDRDGHVRSSRWCAGCHDPVPFFSGAFDDPKFDDVKHPTAHAGITCTVCHSITSIHGPTGNAAFTIEEPAHYPFAYSDDERLQWINNQLIKARPEFHKRTFLKPLHKTAEFCSVCHKVSLPVELNHYKDFLRGQNHYDTFLLSGVSGHGARSFYYPPRAKQNCAECHMPLKESGDFGARLFDDSGTRKVHNHLFPGANTGLPHLLTLEPRYAQHSDGFRRAIKEHSDFLRGTDPEGKDKKLRIDLFGIKEGASTKPERLIAPLRPKLPRLKPGQSYLVEVVIRTLNMGHPFTQGTADSNEVWVDFHATSAGRTLARSGGLADEKNQAGPVDEWSHFVNVLMLDRNGNRINRRNPQDIFTPLYDHQIPPGAAQVAHYRLDVPTDVKAPVRLDVRLRYRKFDYEYMKLVYKDGPVPTLPIVDLCADRVTLPVEGVAGEGGGPNDGKAPPEWQRWNDYGIGALLEGGPGKKGHFRQAEDAFKAMLKLDAKEAPAHAHVNLARVYIEEGELDKAALELAEARKTDPPAPWWSVAWFTAVVNSQTATSRAHVDDVIADLERLTDPAFQPRERGFDFTRDYVVLDLLASRLFKRSQYEKAGSEGHRHYLERAILTSGRVLDLDPEDIEAHDLLKQCYARFAGAFTPPEGAPVPKTADELPDLAAKLADAGADRQARLEAAAGLVRGLEAPARGARPRLVILRELVAKLRTTFFDETDEQMRAARAAVLAALHRESHAAYKLDENARSRATQEYRKKHPAGNYAARDRVIYPTTPAHKALILRVGGLPEE